MFHVFVSVSEAKIMSNKLAIIKTGGKQYKISEGDKLKIEKLPKKEGVDVSFSEVLLYADDKVVDVGTPILKDVKVTAKVLGQGKASKVIIFKYKKRKRYSKKKGHRQPFTEIEITKISKTASSAPKKGKDKK